MMKRTLSLGLTAMVLACQAQSPRVFPVDCPPDDLEALPLVALDSLPRPASLFVPPLPVPSGVLGHRAIIRVFVDSVGHAVRDSISVCGIPNRDYAGRIVRAIAALRFVPGPAQASQIGGHTFLIFQF